MDEWWNRDNSKSFEALITEANFQEIIIYYLLRCPAVREVRRKEQNGKRCRQYSRVSKSGETLRSRGWTGGNLLSLLSRMKNHTATGKIQYQHCEHNTDIVNTVRLLEADSSLSDKSFETVFA